MNCVKELNEYTKQNKKKMYCKNTSQKIALVTIRTFTSDSPSYQYSSRAFTMPGGHWPRKGVWGCAARKGPISSKRVSSQDPLLRKFWNFGLYSLIFHPNFSSQAPKFGNFPLTSPQIWKCSAHKPPFSEANASSQAPHFGNPGRTPLPEKSWVPPGHNAPIQWAMRYASHTTWFLH